MDLIVNDTLVKLTCDYFDSNEIEASKRIIFQCDAVTSMEPPICIKLHIILLQRQHSRN